MKDFIQDNGYLATIQLLREEPNWLPVVLASLEEAKTIPSGQFAGAWILDRAKNHGVQWIPNFRKLVAHGILKKEGDSTRGGRRAYYSMPDVLGVERAVNEWGQKSGSQLYPAHEITGAGISRRQTMSVPFFENLASCGSPNTSEAVVDNYIDVDTTIAKPGYKYFIVRAEGDSMDQAGIHSGDFVLVRVQNHADVGQKVVVDLEDGTTIKELQHQGSHMVLLPRSSNPENKPIVLTANAEIQGVVIAVLTSFKFEK